MDRVGMPEFIILTIVLVTWLIPVAAGVWALLTLHRIRRGQDAIGSQLERLVQLLGTRGS
jgi:hypothetical protein